MAAIDWSDVIALAPTLSTVTDAAQDIILAHVNTALAVKNFGGENAPKTRLARIYLAAHFGALFKAGSTPLAGPVISEATGGVTRAYALINVPIAGSLGSTTYGQLYSGLVATSLARLPRVP